MRQGFTLIQISILLVVASLVMVMVLPSTQTKLKGDLAATNRLNTILTALRQYQVSNGTLPCPADASKPIGNSNYGVSAANSGTTGNCTGGTPAANYVDSTNNVAIGMVPLRSLLLSNDYGLDAYGRTITYAVDTNATTCGWSSNTLTGQLVVTDNGATNNTVAALISHGSDGHGAWLPLTGATGTAVRLNSGSTDADQLTNAHVNASFAPRTPLTNFVRKTPTPTFDDLIVYKTPLWNLNSLPASIVTITSTTHPANGTYSASPPPQYLTFTVTFNGTVVVNTAGGIPYLALSPNTGSIGTGTIGQAQYVSGSGTNTLTFSYLISASDNTPWGLTIAPYVVLNGGTILSGGRCVGLGFTAPNLNGVILGIILIYAADPADHRVHQFNTSGVWQLSIGTGYPSDANGGTIGQAGSSNGQFNIMGGIYGSTTGGPFLSIDTQGNVNELDGVSGGTRIQKFSNTGAYISTPISGLATSGSGIYSGQWTGMTMDGSNNFYLADSNNHRVVEYTNNGTLVRIFGGGASCQTCTSASACTCASGTADGLFGGFISALAVDSSGYLYVADSANARIEKFDTTGSWKQSIGGDPGDGSHPCSQCLSGASSCACQAGSGNGQFSTNATGIAVDLSGNVWETDTYLGRVQKFNSSGAWQLTIGGDYDSGYASPTHTCTQCSSTTACTCYWGTQNSQFAGPGPITTDINGNIYIVDTGNNRIQEFNTNGVWIQSIGGIQNGYDNCQNSPTWNPYQYQYSLSGSTPGCPADTSPQVSNHGAFNQNAGGIAVGR